MSRVSAPWVRIGARVRSAADLQARAARAASGFALAGVAPGDVVAVVLRNDFPMIEATVGAGMAGAYVVPVVHADLLPTCCRQWPPSSRRVCWCWWPRPRLNCVAPIQAARGNLVATGDVGYFDADGDLDLVGRASDMIIFGGSKIYPAEVEQALMRLPGVADCAVFGIPDAEDGEQVCAFVQAEPGVALDAGGLCAALRPHLASDKIPRRVQIVATLPREDTGKLFKRKLRDPFWADTGRRI